MIISKIIVNIIIINLKRQVFMDARYRPEEGETEGRSLTMVEVAGLMIALLFAGQHTSSVTGSWVGLRMLRDAELVKRVNAVSIGVGVIFGCKIVG